MQSKAEKTHKGKPKPLMWREVKYDERFRQDNKTNVYDGDKSCNGGNIDLGLQTCQKLRRWS